MVAFWGYSVFANELNLNLEHTFNSFSQIITIVIMC